MRLGRTLQKKSGSRRQDCVESLKVIDGTYHIKTSYDVVHSF